MLDITRATLGELAGLAIESELVEHCSISKGSVGITIGRLNLALAPHDAATLLRLLIVGSGAAGHVTGATIPERPSVDHGPAVPRTDNRPPVQVMAPTAAQAEPVRPEPQLAEPYQKHELFRAQGAPVQEPSRQPMPEAVTVGGDGNGYGAETISEEYLDSVLNFALSMQIIEGYSKDQDTGTVTLRTGATTTGLSYWETIEYLTNSMLFELRARTDQ